MLRAVQEHEIGGAAFFDQTAIQIAHPRGVAGGEAERGFGWNIPQRRQHRDHPQNAERLHARSCRAVGAQDYPFGLIQFERGTQREQRRLFVAVMDDLDARAALFAEAPDLIQGQGCVPAIDVADDVGAGLENDILVDQA